MSQLSISQIIQHLDGLSVVRKRLLQFQPNDQISIPITSYIIQEHAYKKDVPILPIQARGLFVQSKSNGQSIIVARGYDKFFNGNISNLYLKSGSRRNTSDAMGTHVSIAHGSL